MHMLAECVGSACGLNPQRVKYVEQYKRVLNLVFRSLSLTRSSPKNLESNYSSQVSWDLLGAPPENESR